MAAVANWWAICKGAVCCCLVLSRSLGLVGRKHKWEKRCYDPHILQRATSLGSHSPPPGLPKRQKQPCCTPHPSWSLLSPHQSSRELGQELVRSLVLRKMLSYYDFCFPFSSCLPAHHPPILPILENLDQEKGEISVRQTTCSPQTLLAPEFRRTQVLRLKLQRDLNLTMDNVYKIMKFT